MTATRSSKRATRGWRLLRRPAAGEASGRWSLGFEVTEFDSIRERLAAAGASSSEPKIHAEGFRELVTHDPDGNTLRLFSWPQGH